MDVNLAKKVVKRCLLASGKARQVKPQFHERDAGEATVPVLK